MGHHFDSNFAQAGHYNLLKRSTSEVVDGLLRFDLFIALGFLPAVFGAPSKAILIIDAPDLDHLYQVIKSAKIP